MQNLITGQFVDHVLTTVFDKDATELTVDIPPPTPGATATRRKAAATTPAAVPLAPWPRPSESVPDNLALTSPPHETLDLIWHLHGPPHKLSRTTRYMIMRWCRHRDLALADFLTWVWNSKEETSQRRARYSREWCEWAKKRPPRDDKVLQYSGRSTRMFP